MNQDTARKELATIQQDIHAYVEAAESLRKLLAQAISNDVAVLHLEQLRSAMPNLTNIKEHARKAEKVIQARLLARITGCTAKKPTRNKNQKTVAQATIGADITEPTTIADPASVLGSNVVPGTGKSAATKREAISLD